MNGEQRGEGSAQAIAKALSEASERALLLVHEEIELAKAEVGEKVSALLRGGVVALAAGIFLIAAVQMALAGLALLAWYLLPDGDLEYFWGFFAVAAALVLLALAAGVAAWRAVRRGSPPLPTMAVEEARKLKASVAGSAPTVPGWSPAGDGDGGAPNAG